MKLPKLIDVILILLALIILFALFKFNITANGIGQKCISNPVQFYVDTVGKAVNEHSKTNFPYKYLNNYTTDTNYIYTCECGAGGITTTKKTFITNN